MARDIAAWKRGGETAVLLCGEHCESVREALADYGADVSVIDTITELPAPGTAVLVRDRLTQGFTYPSLHLTVLTESELFGKRASARSRAANGATGSCSRSFPWAIISCTRRMASDGS